MLLMPFASKRYAFTLRKNCTTLRRDLAPCYDYLVADLDANPNSGLHRRYLERYQYSERAYWPSQSYGSVDWQRNDRMGWVRKFKRFQHRWEVRPQHG